MVRFLFLSSSTVQYLTYAAAYYDILVCIPFLLLIGMLSVYFIDRAMEPVCVGAGVGAGQGQGRRKAFPPLKFFTEIIKLKWAHRGGS